MSSHSSDISSSMDLLTVQASLKQRNEEFKVLTEQFLKQRAELYAAKKTDSNREYVNFLEEKLKFSLDEIVELKKKEKEGKKDSDAEIIQIRLEKAETERDEKIDESYQTMAQIEFLLAKLTGKAEVSTFGEFMKSESRILKTDITWENVQSISEEMIGEAIGLVETQKTEAEHLKKEISDARKLAEEYKERALRAEDSLRFESLLTREIQEKVNGISESLETHKKLIAELTEEKESIESEDDKNDEEDEEEYDDEEEEEYDDEEEDYEEEIQFEDE